MHYVYITLKTKRYEVGIQGSTHSQIRSAFLLPGFQYTKKSGGGGGGFFLTFEDFGRMFNHSFPAVCFWSGD